PEVPSSTDEVDLIQRSFARRLDTLEREGFHPVLLSDVHRHLTQGAGLPSKPVVLVFDPGHRHTFDTLQPILKQRHCPAVWLTDEEALQNGDRRYISNHTARRMAQSNLWDVGIYQSGRGLVIHNLTAGAWTVNGDRHAVWSPLAGTSGYNAADRLRG